MAALLVLLVLILLNGLFAMSEIALISARRARLQQLLDEGEGRARLALELSKEPGRFLSTVQVGITLIGVLAGAYGGATLSVKVAPFIERLPLLAAYSGEIAFGLVVVAITYLSLVVGELVPKRLAMQHPERVAARVARPMHVLSRVASPLVSLLSASTDLVLRLMGRKHTTAPSVTEEEVASMLAEGTKAGVFEKEEYAIIERVFRFADRSVASIMTPRPDVECLNLNDPPDRLRDAMLAHPHTRFVVCRDGLDTPVGIVHTVDLLKQCLRGGDVELQPLLRQPPFVPESLPALRVLEDIKRTGEKLVIVIDEYGGVAGIVTLDDLLEAIVGDIPWVDERLEPPAVQRADGSWLVEGMIPLGDFKDLFGLRTLPGEETRRFHTLGGFIVTWLGRIPEAAESFTWGGLRFEVVDMDGKRIDKVLVARATEATDPGPDEPDHNEAARH